MASRRVEQAQAWAALAAVLLVFSAVIYWVQRLDDKSKAENCEGKYRTSVCLSRMLEEVKAKEEYNAKLERLKK